MPVEQTDRIEKLVNKLQLPYHVGSLYIRLVEVGRVEVSSVKEKCDLDIDDFGESLCWLTERGYVYKEMDDYGVEWYIPLDPRIVFKSVYSNFLWDHIATEDDLVCLKNEERENILYFKGNCDTLAKRTFKHYRRHHGGRGIIYISNEKQLSGVLSETILKASKSIFGVTAPKCLMHNISLIWECLKSKMASGIPYKRVSDELTFISFGYLINKRDIEEVGVCLRLVSKPKIKQKFFIIDDGPALIFWGDLPGKRFRFEATLVDNKALVRRFQDKAEELWQAGVTAKTALNYMLWLRKQYMEEVRQLLKNDNEIRFAEGIFDFGVFYKEQYIHLDRESAGRLITKLFNSGLLTQLDKTSYPYGEMRYVPNIRNEFVVFLNSGGREKPAPKWSVGGL